MSNRVEIKFENIIFASRWLQTPLYAGLIVGGILYVYKYIIELINLCVTTMKLPKQHCTSIKSL